MKRRSPGSSNEELPGVPYTLSHELVPDRARISPRLDDRDRRVAQAADAAASARDGEPICAPPAFPANSSSAPRAAAASTSPRSPAARCTMLKSGPAMAPVAGKAYITIEDLGRDAIVCDTGGTTFDVGLVRDGDLVYTRDSWLGRRWLGHMVAMSTVDVRSIGAGGGSIAWIDAGGLLRVGPQSAGAVPGPACYGRRRRSADRDRRLRRARLVRPRLLQRRPHEARCRGRPSRVEKLASAIGRSVPATAFAIITIANELMIKAIHEITVSEGVNPRESVIVAGGGAAGLNILPIARELGCSTTILPKTASAMSACGMQYSDIVFEQTRSRVTMSGSFDLDGVNTALDRDRCGARAIPREPARRRPGQCPQGISGRGALQVAGLGARYAASGRALPHAARTWRRWSRRFTPSTTASTPCATSRARSNASTGAAASRSACRSPQGRCASGVAQRQAEAVGAARGLFRTRRLAQDAGVPRQSSLRPAPSSPVRRSSRSRPRPSSSIRR